MEKIPSDLPDKLQDLPRIQAILCLNVEKSFECLPQGAKNKTFLLAVSGGADSTALALIFYLLSKRNKYNLEIVNINHLLREEAHEEQQFVKQLAEKLELNFHAEYLDTKNLAVNTGIGLEEAGRLGRHIILEKIRSKINAHYIVTGHHNGDLAEDILMRITRGAAWPALGGMKRLDGYMFRPLLYTEPLKLRLFLQNIHLSWHEDSSNKSLDFTRNRFRHVIMPHFLQENENFMQNTVELNNLAQVDVDYWNKRIISLLENFPWTETCDADKAEIFLSSSLLAATEQAERMRIYMRVIARLKEISCQPVHARARTLLKMDKSILHEPAKTFQFPGKLAAISNKNGISFSLPILRKESQTSSGQNFGTTE